MKTTKTLLATLTLAGTMFALAPALAHHSIVGEFDTETSISLRGTITKLEWFNPHIWFYMDVVAENGEVQKWQCEMGSPNRLIRAGFTQADLPIGTVVRTEGNPARDGSNTCSTRELLKDDGTPVFQRTGNNG